MKSINKALIRGTIVLIPTYIVAYITDKMVYVVPMLAACGFIAASLFENDTTPRIDDNATGKDSFKDFNEDGEGE